MLIFWVVYLFGSLWLDHEVLFFEMTGHSSGFHHGNLDSIPAVTLFGGVVIPLYTWILLIGTVDGSEIRRSPV